VAERESERVVSWLEARADDLLASAWTAPEVASALSLKVRTGALDLSARAAAMARFNGLMSSLLILDIEPLHFLLAASFAGQHDLALRASDALHLAVCADRGASLATLDGRMRDAALALGVAVESI
jgi:predicted nucleic acid-binding protein